MPADFSKPVSNCAQAGPFSTGIGGSTLETGRKQCEKQLSQNFAREVKARVNDYFEQNRLSRHANAAMISKTVVWLFLIISKAAYYSAMIVVPLLLLDITWCGS